MNLWSEKITKLLDANLEMATSKMSTWMRIKHQIISAVFKWFFPLFSIIWQAQESGLGHLSCNQKGNQIYYLQLSYILLIKLEVMWQKMQLSVQGLIPFIYFPANHWKLIPVPMISTRIFWAVNSEKWFTRLLANLLSCRNPKSVHCSIFLLQRLK